MRAQCNFQIRKLAPIPLCVHRSTLPYVLYLRWLLTHQIASAASFLAELVALPFTHVSDTLDRSFELAKVTTLAVPCLHPIN